MGNSTFEETPVLRHAVQHLRGLLPSSWGVELSDNALQHADRGSDADLIIRTPAGATEFIVQVKTGELSAQSVQNTMARLHNLAATRQAVFITPFANPALRRACEAAGVSYLDATGWVYLRSDDTGLFITHEGAKRSPSSEKRDTTMGRLDGPGASAIIRSLWEIKAPVGVRALATNARVSPGTAAKVLPSLALYGAIERDSAGAVTTVDRRLLLERWVQDYGFLTTNSKPRWLLAPRGPDYAYKHLRNRYAHGVDQAVLALTGYLAASTALPEGILPVIPHTMLSIYAADPELVGSSLDLKPATRQTANVVIVRPRDVSLLRPYPAPVPVPQALADLMTMGGRFPELAEQLFEVLGENDL